MVQINGVTTGIVTDNEDPENLGRVKVQIDLFDDESYHTVWARIATLAAGSDRGSFFIPNVGDEVLVAFHKGNLSTPYVIGSLWNKDAEPPDGDVENKISKFKTESGMELIFDDQEEILTVKTAKGHMLEIKNKDDTITLTDDGGSNNIVIQGGSSGKITIESGQSTISLTSSGEVSIKGQSKVEVSGAQITIKADAALKLQGATVDVSADGPLNLKGAIIKLN